MKGLSKPFDHTDPNTFVRNQKVWIMIDGKRVMGIYDEPSGDGFHYVHTVETPAGSYRATSSEVTERHI